MFKYKGISYDDYLLINMLKDANFELRINREQCLEILNNLLLKGKGFVDALAIYEVLDEKVADTIKKYENKREKRANIEMDRQIDRQTEIMKNRQIKLFIKSIEDEQKNKDEIIKMADKLNNDLDKHFNQGNFVGVSVVCAEIKYLRDMQKKWLSIYDMRDRFLVELKKSVENKMFVQ